jgi:acetyl esterase/lipase
MRLSRNTFIAGAMSMALSVCSGAMPVWARHHHHYHTVDLLTVDTARNAFVVHNLCYVQHRRTIEQTLDLYIPAFGKPPYPVILWLHGGSWQIGDKNDSCVACDHLLAKYAVASVNYRLDSEAKFPAQIYDVKAAIRFLRAKAQTYKLDASRIGVWGQSAGGHLAALLGTSGGVNELEGDEGWSKYSSKVQAVCDWCGPTDFETIKGQSGANCKIQWGSQSSPLFNLLGGKMDKSSLAAASPVSYVSQYCPPFLIMHGLNDDAVPPAQSQELRDRLQAKGCDVQLHLIKGFGHGLGDPEQFKTVESFFDVKLNSPKPR